MSISDFECVYDEYVWYVYGFFAYRCKNRSDAEDLTQVTFERALRSWKRYDASRGAMRTWLLAIARNLLIDHARADRSSKQPSLDDPDCDDEMRASTSDRVDLGLEPDLERALGGLGEREREIIALRFGGDLSGPEIAELTGLSLANVQQILSRSLRRLRAVLEEAPSPQVTPPAVRIPQRSQPR